jgi:hypothetical protein
MLLAVAAVLTTFIAGMLGYRSACVWWRARIRSAARADVGTDLLDDGDIYFVPLR